MSKVRYFKGYICPVNNEIFLVYEPDVRTLWGQISLFGAFESFMNYEYFNDSYEPEEGEEDFWGSKIREPKVLIQIYYTDKECSFEEAQMSLDTVIYGGAVEIDIANQGYSDWTITGYDVEKAMIGNHDLYTEISAHKGQYANIYVEIFDREKT